MRALVAIALVSLVSNAAFADEGDDRVRKGDEARKQVAALVAALDRHDSPLWSVAFEPTLQLQGTHFVCLSAAAWRPRPDEKTLVGEIFDNLFEAFFGNPHRMSIQLRPRAEPKQPDHPGLLRIYRIQLARQ